MIQRIQSVYLFLVVVLSALLFFVNMYSVETSDPTEAGLQHYNSGSNMIYLVLTLISGLLSVVAIFLFRNRNLQVRLCNLNMLVICVFTGTVFYFADHSKSVAGSIVHYQAGSYFPLIQLVLTFLAMRAIRKDEQLVRSADRLR
jgi:hypothetical protein